jgi:hypothetical protein
MSPKSIYWALNPKRTEARYHQTVRTKLPIPEPQGSTPMERMDWAFRTVLKVPKAALVKDEERAKHPRQKKTPKAS